MSDPSHAPIIGAPFQALLDSPRTSSRTRAILAQRAEPDDPAYHPAVLTMAQLVLLRAVIDRVVPQPEAGRIDLAARIDRQLADGEGDGWRFADLPPDADAYREGLDTLAAQCFDTLDPVGQDALLHGLEGGMAHWFEDLRGDAVRLYVAHPATLARMGYSGTFYGGDGEPKTGFTAIDPGQTEPWEPSA